MTKEFKPGFWRHMRAGLMHAGLSPADVYPIGPPFIESIEKDIPMTKEEIEKQIAELQAKLEEMETGPKLELKPAFNNDSYGCGSSDHIFVSSKTDYVELALESAKGLMVCVWLNDLEAKSIIQALQKCVDWLEKK